MIKYVWHITLKSELSKVVLSVLGDLGEEGEMQRGEIKARQGNGRQPHPWRLSESGDLVFPFPGSEHDITSSSNQRLMDLCQRFTS